jgi:hypothetical protein
MKKTVIFCLLLSSLYASDDYTPISKISNDKKVEYNFMKNTNQKPNKEEKFESVKSIANSNKKEEFQSIKSTEPIELKNGILQEVKSDEIKETTPTVDKSFVKDYKKENILQDTKKYSQDGFSKDFSITPKITYTYLTTDLHSTERVRPIDRKNVLVPELSLRYKEHTLKAELLDSKAHYTNVLIVDSDLETRIKWLKLYYLYNYQNVNLGLAYNNYKADFIIVDYNRNLKKREEFPSLELNAKNEENQLEINYGLSYGKSTDIDYAYEYYVNLGYKIFQNDVLNINAGYRNRTIDYDNVKYQYRGPTLSLSSTF